jgi:hypothetical protein
VSIVFFLAAVACFALALVSLLVPTLVLGAPALVWFIAGALAWFLGDHARPRLVCENAHVEVLQRLPAVSWPAVRSPRQPVQ